VVEAGGPYAARRRARRGGRGRRATAAAAAKSPPGPPTPAPAAGRAARCRRNRKSNNATGTATPSWGRRGDHTPPGGGRGAAGGGGGRPRPRPQNRRPGPPPPPPPPAAPPAAAAKGRAATPQARQHRSGEGGGTVRRRAAGGERRAEAAGGERRAGAAVAAAAAAAAGTGAWHRAGWPMGGFRRHAAARNLCLVSASTGLSDAPSLDMSELHVWGNRAIAVCLSSCQAPSGQNGAAQSGPKRLRGGDLIGRIVSHLVSQQIYVKPAALVSFTSRQHPVHSHLRVPQPPLL